LGLEVQDAPLTWRFLFFMAPGRGVREAEAARYPPGWIDVLSVSGNRSEGFADERL
jgi:hypothetical protein